MDAIFTGGDLIMDALEAEEAREGLPERPLHLVDRVGNLGVSYLCKGAVCAGWWKSNYRECEPGHALVGLYADGTRTRQYVTYGGKAQE